MPLANHLAGGIQETIWRLAADMHRVAGLQNMQLLYHFEHEVGHLADTILAVAGHATDIDIGEIVIGAAFAGRDTHLGRCGMVVDLDPEAAYQLLGFFSGQGSRSKLSFVEGRQVLVEMPRIHGIPTVELGNRAKMHEPVHLDRFVEGPRRIGRHPAADFGNLSQLGDTLWIALCSGHLISQIGVSLGKNDHGIARDIHRLELLGLVGRFRVIEKIQCGDLVGDLLFEIEHPLAINLAIQRGVPRCSLLHELGEEAGLIGGPPFIRDMAEDSFANRFALPVRDHFACVGRNIFFTDGVTLLFAGIEDMEIFNRVTGQLGEGRYRLRPRAAFGDDQLVITDVESLFLAVVEKIQRPHDRDRVLAVILPVESRLVQSPLDRQTRLRLHAQLAQTLDAFIHPRADSGIIFRVKITFGSRFSLRYDLQLILHGKHNPYLLTLQPRQIVDQLI